MLTLFFFRTACLGMSLLCHSYVTRMYSYVIRMSVVCTRMSSVCHSYVITSMSSVCHSYVLVCHPYFTRMWFYHKPDVKYNNRFQTSYNVKTLKK